MKILTVLLVALTFISCSNNESSNDSEEIIPESTLQYQPEGSVTITEGSGGAGTTGTMYTLFFRPQ